VLVDQIRSLDARRILRVYDVVADEHQAGIDAALRDCLAL
jgi:mRNA-degrading endonuclease toxin of MazEF toxin-antitoxin module